MTRKIKIFSELTTSFHFKPARISAALLLTLIVSACQVSMPGDPGKPPAPDLSFTAQRVTQIHVKSIRFEDDFTLKQAPPNIEHQFDILPAQIVHNWIDERLRAVGNDGVLTVRIVDAGVVEKRLRVKQGVLGSLSNEIELQWEGRLDVRLTYVGQFGTTSTRVIATSSQELNEKVIEYDRQRAYYAILEGLALELDTSLSKEFKGPLSLLVLQN